MKESLVEKLNRIEEELALLKNKPTPKPVNYQEGLSLLEEANKNLNKILDDLNKKYELLERELDSLKNKKPVKQIDYSEDIKKLNVRIDPLVKSIKEIKNKPVTPLVTEKIKTVDHSKELAEINSDIANIKKNASNKKEINIKEEVKNIITLDYVNRLYRNK